MTLEDIIKSLATNTMNFQKETRASIQNLENQMSQLAISVSKLETQRSSKLPSRPIKNLKENACAIVLRSGKEVSKETPAK